MAYYEPNPITADQTVKQIMDRVNEMMDPLQKSDIVTTPILSDTEPTLNLTDGVLWYNTTSKEVKIYLNGSFRPLGDGSGSAESASYEGYQKRIVLNTASNTIDIGIDSFDSAQDILWVYQNSVFMGQGTDYTLINDGKTLQKIDGSWEAGTIIDLSLLVRVPPSSVIPTMAMIEEFYTIASDNETDIQIPIPEYNYLTDRLHVYHDHLLLYQGTDWDLNEDGTRITLNHSVVTGDKLLFTVLKKIKDQVPPGTDGSTLANDSIPDSKLAPDNKVGSLATLKTTTKKNAVSAINEVYDNINQVQESIPDVSGIQQSVTELGEDINTINQDIEGIKQKDTEQDQRLSYLENITTREGVILLSPDKSTWKMTVDNTGALTTTKTAVEGIYEDTITVVSPDGSGWVVSVTNEGTLVTTKVQ